MQLKLILPEMVPLTLRRFLAWRVQEVACPRNSCGIWRHINLIDIFQSAVVAAILLKIVIVTLLSGRAELSHHVDVARLRRWAKAVNLLRYWLGLRVA